MKIYYIMDADESCEEDTLELTEYKSERRRLHKLRNKMKGIMEIQQAADRQPVVPDQVLLIQTTKMIYEVVQDKETIHANPAPAVALNLDCGSELVVGVADIVLPCTSNSSAPSATAPGAPNVHDSVLD